MNSSKIAFFDIDGTITSEIDGSVPDSVVLSIRKARKNGHLMFINTGRCFQNVEKRFRSIGFDGYVCGCGTNIYLEEQELLHVEQSHDIVQEILTIARKTQVDILFESKTEVVFDLSHPLQHPKALSQYYRFKERHYDMSHDLEADDFTCDKFVIWFSHEQQLTDFLKVSNNHFTCIDRGGNFREFVPHHYSKATGIQYLLDYFKIAPKQAYAFGDSNNDYSMLSYLPNSIAMGNAEPPSLFEQVSYVTAKSSEDGIQKALAHFQFI